MTKFLVDIIAMSDLKPDKRRQLEGLFTQSYGLLWQMAAYAKTRIKINRQSIDILILFVLAIVPYLLSTRFDTNVFFFSGDVIVPELNIKAALSRDWYSWKYAYDALGSSDIFSISFVFEDLVKFFLILLGMTPGYTHWLVHLLYFSVTGIGMYVFMCVIFPNRPNAGLLAGVVYLFNFYRLSTVLTGQLQFYVFYVTTPFLMATVANGTNKQDKKVLLYLPLLSWLNIPAAVNTSFIIVQSGLLVISVFISWLTSSNKKVVLKYAFIYGSIFLAVNALWWVPLAKWALSGGALARESTVLSRWVEFNGRYLVRQSNLSNMFRMLWPGSFMRPFVSEAFEAYQNPFLIIFSYLIPFFTFSSLLFSKKIKLHEKVITLTFLILFLATLLVVSGASLPGLAPIQLYLLSNPFFSVTFRNPYTKAGIFLAISASVLVGWTVEQLPFSIRKKTRLVLGMAAIICCSFITFWNGNFLNMTYKVTIPSAYASIADHLNQYLVFFRVWQLPYFTSNSFKSYKWGYSGSADVLPMMLKDRSLIVNAQGMPPERWLSEAIYTGDESLLSGLLYLFSVGKVVYHKDADIQHYNEAIPLEQIDSALTRPPFTLIQETPELTLYNVKPTAYPIKQIYAAQHIVHVRGELYDFGKIFAAIQPSTDTAYLFTDVGNYGVPKTNQAFVDTVDETIIVGYPILDIDGTLRYSIPISSTGVYDVLSRSAIPVKLVINQQTRLTIPISGRYTSIGQVQLNTQDGQFIVQPFFFTDQKEMEEGIDQWKIENCSNNSHIEIAQSNIVTITLINHSHELIPDNRSYIQCFAARQIQTTPGSEYLLQFDYQFIEGAPPILSVAHRNDKGDTDLFPYLPLQPYFTESQRWHSYRTIVQSRIADKQLVFGFYANPPLTSGEVTRHQYKVRLAKLYPISVIFKSVGEHSQRHVPELSYTKINPSQYLVTIHNATGPFLLVLSESFDPMWKARINDTIGVDEQNHIQANYYANGWWIDRTGDFTITIRHATQQYIYAGWAISLMSSLIVLGFIVVCKFKKR